MTITSAYNNFGYLFGAHVSISGDVNNDGFNDIVSVWDKLDRKCIWGVEEIF